MFTDLLQWANTASLIAKFIMTAFIVIYDLMKPVVERILELVNEFYDLFDAKAADGEEVTIDEKRAATETVVETVLLETHGSGNVVAESLIRAATGMAVYLLGAQRYGENSMRDELAQIKGYIGKGDDLERAAKTHAGFKLFGI